MFTYQGQKPQAFEKLGASSKSEKFNKWNNPKVPDSQVCHRMLILGIGQLAPSNLFGDTITGEI